VPFSEENRNAHSDTAQIARGVPACRVRNTAVDGRYRIDKEVRTDPWRDVMRQRVRFRDAQGHTLRLRLYAVLAPHLANRGRGNTAWVGDYKDTPMLFAERGSVSSALACSVPWLPRSVGFVGFSAAIDRWDGTTYAEHIACGRGPLLDGVLPMFHANPAIEDRVIVGRAGTARFARGHSARR